MKIYNSGYNGKICNVIPVMDYNKFIKSDYYNFMIANNLTDFLILEDSAKDFHFSKNMNLGINQAIESGYNYIILSTDNLEFENKGIIFYTLKNLKSNRYYVMEKLNGYINQYNISNSSFEFLFNGLSNALPFYSIMRYLRMKKLNLPNLYIFRSKLNGYKNIMPFSIFDSKILYDFPFNENIKNSLEDSLLSYQLWKNKVNMEIIKTNVIHKGNLSFKKINEKNKLSGHYNFEDWKNNLKIINSYIKCERGDLY